MSKRWYDILFYKPLFGYWITDIVLLLVSFFVVLMWFPLSTEIPFQKYWAFSLEFSACWIITSYFAHRYVRVKYMRVGVSLLRLLLASACTFFIMWGYMTWLAAGRNYSIWVLLTIWLAMVIISFLFLLLFHAYHYALNAEQEIEREPDSGPHSVLKEPFYYEGHQKENIASTIVDSTSVKVLKFLEDRVAVYSTNTYILRTAELFNIQKLKLYRFDTIINLMPLNQIRGINKMFGVVNDHLPDEGQWVVCFEPQEVVKHKILKKYPAVINYIVYSCFFLYKRVLPKLFLTSRFYYDLTEGKDRVLSKAEVLGRLCYCGFDIVDEEQIDDLVYVVARRSFRPQTVQKRLYGPLVKLNRIGKNNMFTVYKFRTMHPYSEFMQQYIYDKYGLQEGGKFNDDMRVTTLGKFLRKYWLDELPMFINLLKGDMKLVGVRPISKQYFSLYSEELQEKRVQHKPGLLPPFYADMPKTLQEIEDSEMRYLIACEQNGTLRTDFIYFWKIIYTIVFRRARSH